MKISHATFYLLAPLIQPGFSFRPGPPSPCAVSCRSALQEDGHWSHIHNLRHLRACNETTVFQTAIRNPIDDPDTPLTLKACSVSEGDGDGSASSHRHDRGESTLRSSCAAGSEITETEMSLQITVKGASDENSGPDIAQASSALSTVFSQKPDCETTAIFAKSGHTIMGMYVGAAIQKSSSSELLDRFTSELVENPRRSQASVQLCGDRRPSSLVVGIFVDNTGNISAVHDAVRKWGDASCVTDFDEEESMEDVKMSFVPIRSLPLSGAKAIMAHNSVQKRDPRSLAVRAECEAVEVDGGDSCWSISDSCGITEDELKSFNPTDNLCGTIQPGQYVCCSEGTLPDFSPQPDSDGTCFSHVVGSKETCFVLAQQFNTTVEAIEDVNKETWGWVGCGGLQEDQTICLGSGRPPMPTTFENAQCGPQMVGTQSPPDGTNLEELNPCPLNACCSGWSFCGTTAEFCTPAPADTGAPGATKPGETGCFSNCGTDIINNSEAPGEFIDLVYFEAWNLERPCAHLDVADIPDRHTHIHFAFVDITPDFAVDTSSIQEQFDRFLDVDFAKRIVSFGGWAFSTEDPTYQIFRLAVSSAENMERLATNVVDFVVSNGLDGVDFDWEYPGAPDIRGIEADDPRNGGDYLEFLKIVRKKLPGDKSLAIAAPASFWYLKAFPIDEIAEVVDYIVYMTYDLHGQWDYSIWWASPGCTEESENLGNCLRSHINMTETENSLSMITKAGVSSNKVLVGITSYGRSFKMVEPGCTGPMCKFVAVGQNNESAALPGVCTETAGYLSEYEIRMIISEYRNGEYWPSDEFEGTEEGANRVYLPEGAFKTWYDEDSQSDILVYDETDWVAWMDTDTKRARVDRYRDLNFLGVSDWAVDLSAGYDYMDDNSELFETGEESTCDTDLKFSDLQDLEKNGGNLSSSCAALHTLKILADMLTDAVSKYKDLDKNYDTRFGYYVKAVKEMATTNLNTCLSWANDGPCNRYFTCTYRQNGQDIETGRCPLSDNPITQDRAFTITYELDDEAGFNQTIEEEFGVSADWVEITDIVTDYDCVRTSPPPGSNPRPVDENTLERRQCVPIRQEWNRRPAIRDDAKIPNPKEVVKAALEDLDEILTEISAAYIEILFGIWEGDPSELVEAISIPVLMVAQSVESMEQVREIGEEVEKEEREAKTKEIILTVLLVAFIFIPIAGEAALAFGFTSVTIARLATMIGIAGDAALTAYDAVENPESALLMAFLMMIPLRGVSRDNATVKRIIEKKKALGGAALDALGVVFKRHDTSIQNILNVCRK